MAVAVDCNVSAARDDTVAFPMKWIHREDDGDSWPSNIDDVVALIHNVALVCLDDGLCVLIEGGADEMTDHEDAFDSE